MQSMASIMANEGQHLVLLRQAAGRDPVPDAFETGRDRRAGAQRRRVRKQMPFQVGPLELIVVLAIALIVLGPKKLPEAGRALGKGIREFRESLAGGDEDDEKPSMTPRSLTPAAGRR